MIVIRLEDFSSRDEEIIFNFLNFAWRFSVGEGFWMGLGWFFSWFVFQLFVSILRGFHPSEIIHLLIWPQNVWENDRYREGKGKGHPLVLNF
jgi:hypothetical protein